MSDLINHHLTWLRAGGRSSRTREARQRVLHHADNALPWGLDDADASELADYLCQWRGWTLHTYDYHLRGYFRWAHRFGHLTIDPMTYLDRPAEGPRVPNPCTDEELAIALTAPPLPWRRAVLMAAYAGMRCCEIVVARRRDLTETSIRIYGKGGKIRTVPLAAPLREELAGADGLLCLGARGRPLTAQMLTQMQRAVWRRIGLDDEFRLHRVRHWFATRLLDGGADIRVVQELLGHASLNSTQGYTRVAVRRMASAVATLPAIGERASL